MIVIRGADLFGSEEGSGVLDAVPPDTADKLREMCESHPTVVMIAEASDDVGGLPGWLNCGKTTGGTLFFLKSENCVTMLVPDEQDEAQGRQIPEPDPSDNRTWRTSSGYAERGGNTCPMCGSEEIEGGPHNVESPFSDQEVQCNSCGGSWRDFYRIVGYEISELPEAMTDAKPLPAGGHPMFGVSVSPGEGSTETDTGDFLEVICTGNIVVDNT